MGHIGGGHTNNVGQMGKTYALCERKGGKGWRYNDDELFSNRMEEAYRLCLHISKIR